MLCACLSSRRGSFGATTKSVSRHPTDNWGIERPSLISRGKSLHAKLWLAGSLLLIFELTLVIANSLLPAHKAVDRLMLGHDFTAFYSAGHFAGLRQFDKLYDIEAIKRFEQRIGREAGLSLGDAYGPYWNPPFYAWLFAPLARLPY